MKTETEVKFFDVENEEVDVRDLAFSLQSNDPELINEAIEYSLKLLRDEDIRTYSREDNILITEVGYYVIIPKATN